jgi:hypothetical protein
MARASGVEAGDFPLSFVIGNKGFSAPYTKMGADGAATGRTR